MKHLKPFKLFEELIPKPRKKFPTDKAVHWNYIHEIVEKSGLDPHNLKKGMRDSTLQDFFFDKCSQNNIVFPKVKEQSTWKEKDARYEKFIFKESVFLIPISYDPSGDESNYKQKKSDFITKMKNMMGHKYKTKEEMDKFEQDLLKNVHFGPSSYDWVNPALKVIHDKLGKYYTNDKLRVWMPADRDYDHWEGYDYPHKYNVVGHLDRPDGVYFLSDIEKYIDDKYGIKDDKLYEFIINNEYIEGRYWERVWSFSIDEKNPGKLDRKGMKTYGMEATENINHILNILENDFKDDIKGTDYEGFPVYIDYYKKIKPKY